MLQFLTARDYPAFINKVEKRGNCLEEAYPIDESQVVSNAGDAEIYEYKGVVYEIIKWNERAEEHEKGEKTISQVADSLKEYRDL